MAVVLEGFECNNIVMFYPSTSHPPLYRKWSVLIKSTPSSLTMIVLCLSSFGLFESRNRKVDIEKFVRLIVWFGSLPSEHARLGS